MGGECQVTSSRQPSFVLQNPKGLGFTSLLFKNVLVLNKKQSASANEFR